MLNPQDRIAMVSGAARGIGRAVVERLLESGWRVSAGVRDARGLAASDRLLLHRYDAESLDSAKAWLAATLARFGALHALVNAAGINGKATLADEDETALDTLWAINVKAPMRLIRCALPALRRCGEGRVVNVASLFGTARQLPVGSDAVTDVVVIGAGISGAATAYELATAGISVTLLDRYGPAAMASGWTLAGVRQSGRHAAELPLAQAAVADWEDLADKLGAPTRYVRRGNLRLARTQDDMASLTAMVRAQSAAGLTLEMLDRDALHALAPAIAPDVLGASHCPTDGHADPHATVAAFVAASVRAGAELRFGEAAIAIEADAGRVEAVRTERGRIPCGAVVLAAGVMGNDLLAPLGLEVPMTIRGVTLLRTAPAAPVLDQVIGVADASCAGRQEVDGRFRFTGSGGAWQGGTDFADAPAQQGRRPGPRLRPLVAEVARVADLFGALVPATLEAALDETWVGLIDQTPDALPVIEAGAGPRGLVIAMGFSGHGFCLGPVTGRICASLARGETPNLPIAPFALSRFGAAAGAAEALSLHG